MIKYVALLRGITPSNPNMRNEKLRIVFEDLGFQNVKTVISSGNVLFDAAYTDVAALEAMIEDALRTRLSLTSTTIIRSLEQLQQLADKSPFQQLEHSQKSYLIVTFLKATPSTKLIFPQRYRVLAAYDREICSVADLAAVPSPDLMSWIERQHSKEITTRTWKTVGRILAAMKKTG